MTQKSVANIDLDPVVRAMVDAGLNELVRQGVAYVVSAAVAQHHDETQIETPHFEFGSDTPTGYVKVSPMSAMSDDERKLFRMHFASGDPDAVPDDDSRRLVILNRVKDAHTEHCCSKHGCKYGQADCTVATGQKEQSHPCDYCAEEVKADRDTLLDEVREALAASGFGELNGFDNPVLAIHAMSDRITELALANEKLVDDGEGEPL